MITEKIILWDTKYGRIRCNLYKLMKSKKITLYQLSRLSNIRPDIIKKYADNQMMRYDTSVLSKICFVFNCSISDVIEYVNKK